MAAFSGALKLVDLDDFITPSQVSFAWTMVVLMNEKLYKLTFCDLIFM